MPCTVTATTSSSEPWVCSWFSSSQPTSGEAFPLTLEMPATLHHQTLRQTLRLSLGGSKLRFVFSNRYGQQPLVLGECFLSVIGEPALANPVRITFDGDVGVSIPTGETIYSDVIDMRIPSLSILQLDAYLPERTPVSTFHWDARQFSQLLPGNQVAKGGELSGQTISSRLLLEAVHIQPELNARTVVAIGDSMVDGNGVEMGTYGRWTDYLAERFVRCNIALANAGQSGSRLLKDGIGISTLSRFERDVLTQPGITACIVQVGINDLGLAGTALDADSPTPTAEILIAGYRRLLSMAQQRNIRMIAVTLVPLRSVDEYGLANFYQPEKESVRQSINHWIRTSGEFDAVIDSDLWVRHPECSQQLNPQYDSGDHLHFNHAGHLLIAKAVSLKVILGE